MADPGKTEAIDVEQPIACSDLVLGGDLVRVMGEKFRQVMLMDLFRDGVGLGKETRLSERYEARRTGAAHGSDQDILQETFLALRHVGEPAARWN